MNASGRGPRPRLYRPATAASRTAATRARAVGRTGRLGQDTHQVRCSRSVSTAPQARSVASRSVSASNVTSRAAPTAGGIWARLSPARPRDREHPSVEQVARDRSGGAQFEPGAQRPRRASGSRARSGTSRRREERSAAWLRSRCRAFLRSRRATSRGPARLSVSTSCS